MGNKSWVVHLKNKFPGAKVISSDQAIDVYHQDGTHIVAMRKDGSGMWSDQSEAQGLSERFCLAPIPKDARIHKVQDGKIALDEEHEARGKKGKEFHDEKGKVLSIAELNKQGFAFCDKGRCVARPEKKASQKPANDVK